MSQTRAGWKDLKTIIQYWSWWNGIQSDWYYISSADKSAEAFYRSMRGHWSIENRLHWSLDMAFGEGAAQVSKDHAPENLNILWKIALSLLRAAPDPADFMFTVFFGK